uniref:Uncharacterized protein n=1 Tax=Oreochromis niloticus TaxID=8128 RepID=A0A669B6B6_ORENI
MLITIKTSFHFQIGARFAREQEPLPYVVSQPLPWQVHSVSLSRRSSKADEVSYSKIDTAHHNVHYKPHQKKAQSQTHMYFGH